MAKMKKVPGKTVRFCVIGVGSMGQSHCEMLRKIGETELTAVCDNDAGNSRRAGKKFGVPSFSDHRQLAKAGLCDAVLVAAPHPFHPDITIDCANAGLHVLCEKPLSERVSTADKMIESARINGVALGVDFPLRTRPEIIKAIDFVR